MNTVTISGIVGQDPEARYTDSGMMIARISLAVYAGKDKDSDWIMVKGFEKTAEIIAERAKAKARCVVHGRLAVDKWTDRETGKPRSVTYVIANEIHISEVGK